MFHLVHIDLFPNIFEYLSQKELLDILLINKLLYQQVMKYITNTLFTKFIIHMPIDRYEISLIQYTINKSKELNNNIVLIWSSFNYDMMLDKYSSNVLRKKLNNNDYIIMLNWLLTMSCWNNSERYIPIIKLIMNGATKCSCGKYLVGHIRHYSIKKLSKYSLKFADISVKEYIKTEQNKLLHKSSHPGKRTFRKK